MIAALFLLFLVTMILAIANKEKLSFIAFGIAITVNTLWFLHHATSSLTIQL